MNTYSVFEFLLELNQESTFELIKTYFNESGKKTNLIFPIDTKGNKRISEQELRIAMISLLHFFNYPQLEFAVEAPTVGKYSFTGKSKRSGATDLSFYNKGEKILNVEFKANNPSQESIDKDIEKLVNENCYGAWCHIFENEDSGTLISIFNKLSEALQKYDSPKYPLYFSFLILKTRTLISRKGKQGECNGFRYKNVFTVSYSHYSKLPIGKHHLGDWQIDKV